MEASRQFFIDVCIANDRIPRAAISKSGPSPGLDLRGIAITGYLETNRCSVTPNIHR